MLFNSYIFIFAFLPIVWLGYFAINKISAQMAKGWLVIASLFFYGYFNNSYIFILLGSISVNYLLHLLLTKDSIRGWSRKITALLGVLCNISLLVWFKYMDFLIGNINDIFNTAIPLLHIVLPLGISFFTFQQISFMIDSYRGDTKRLPFVQYALYISFFPQLIAGPIVLQSEMIPQIVDHTRNRINSKNMAQGLTYFIIGLSKKILIADTLGRVVDYGFPIAGQLNVTTGMIVMLSYTFQIYFDFSGYCDMAIGLGKMFNFELPINFNSPYQAKNIIDFWDRWHMTLTRFFTRYLYIPLGGNRKGKNRTYLNVFVVFLVSGIWHGAAWTFVLWGMMHGIASVIYRMNKNKFDRIPIILQRLMTFGFVSIAWVFFRATTIGQAGRLLLSVFRWRGDLDTNILKPGFLICFLIAMLLCLAGKNSHAIVTKMKYNWLTVIVLGLLSSLCILAFSNVSTFLYFNF